VTAYATIDDVLAFFKTEPQGTRRERLESLLQTATDELTGELGYDYFRHPTSGSRTWTVNGRGGTLLHFHRGFVALDKLEISLDFGQTFIELPATDWTTFWDAQGSDDPPAGEPWFHLQTLPLATYRTFPRGTAVVRFTGASGWPAIPSPLVEGVAERARQIAYADPSFEGVIAADPEYGQPVVSPSRWPDVTWKFIQREKQRFMACSI